MHHIEGIDRNQMSFIALEELVAQAVSYGTPIWNPQTTMGIYIYANERKRKCAK